MFRQIKLLTHCRRGRRIGIRHHRRTGRRLDRRAGRRQVDRDHRSGDPQGCVEGRHQGRRRDHRHRRASGRRHALRRRRRRLDRHHRPEVRSGHREEQALARCSSRASTATVDFNPVADRLRVMGSDGTSLRVNVDDGKVTVDGSHKYKEGDANAGKTPKVVAGAYTQFVEGHQGDHALQHRRRDRCAGDAGAAERRRAQHRRLARHGGQRPGCLQHRRRAAKTRTTPGW